MAKERIEMRPDTTAFIVGIAEGFFLGLIVMILIISAFI
jgi:hypothetical protein